jgi:hypothetical protein
VQKKHKLSYNRRIKGEIIIGTGVAYYKYYIRLSKPENELATPF